MVDRIVLRTDGGTLVLQLGPGTNRWTRCYLEGDQSVFLGAETASYLVKSLLIAVGDEAGLETREPFIEPSGREARWILSLSEAHCSLYLTAVDSGRLLFWMDGEGKNIANLVLTPKDCLEWSRQLEEVSTVLVAGG